MGRQGLATVSRIFPARVLPGPCECPRQESCSGLASVFGKEPCRGLVGILGKEPCSCLVFWSSSRICRLSFFTKICMPPCRHFSSLGSNAVDGVGTIRLKGRCDVGAGRAAPARLLPGLCRLPRQGSYRGKANLIALSSAPLVGALLW